MKSPDPQSKRSRKRRNRNFKGVSSTRKHRRAMKRQDQTRFFNNTDHEPGVKADCATGPNPRKGWSYTAGGALHYH